MSTMTAPMSTALPKFFPKNWSGSQCLFWFMSWSFFVLNSEGIPLQQPFQRPASPSSRALPYTMHPTNRRVIFRSTAGFFSASHRQWLGDTWSSVFKIFYGAVFEKNQLFWYSFGGCCMIKGKFAYNSLFLTYLGEKLFKFEKNWWPLERYFQGLSFDRNFVFLAQIL